MLIKQDQQAARHNQKIDEENYLMFHPKPFTLHARVVSKTFTYQGGKYGSDDSMEDVSKQADGYLKAIKTSKTTMCKLIPLVRGYYQTLQKH